MSRTLCGLALLAAVLVTGACGSSAPAPAAAPARLMMQDPWVKTARSGMTAAYGTLLNGTDREVVVVSATSSASPAMELHETTMVEGKMAMRPKDGGFVIPAKGRHEFAPGGDHLMLMDVTTPVKPGDEVTFTLTLRDGGTLTFTALGKDFAGGNESYQPGLG